jgi:hypothetical protein
MLALRWFAPREDLVFDGSLILGVFLRNWFADAIKLLSLTGYFVNKVMSLWGP